MRASARKNTGPPSSLLNVRRSPSRSPLATGFPRCCRLYFCRVMDSPSIPTSRFIYVSTAIGDYLARADSAMRDGEPSGREFRRSIDRFYHSTSVYHANRRESGRYALAIPRLREKSSRDTACRNGTIVQTSIFSECAR